MAVRILVVDEEPKWIDFVGNYLGKTFEVRVAIDLETTLAKLRRNRYDLIVASSRRLDVLKTISEKYPEKRFVVATGPPTTREAIDMYRLGALDYFAKDFQCETMSQKIFETIQKSSEIFAQLTNKANKYHH